MIIKPTRLPGEEHSEYVGPKDSLSVDVDAREIRYHDGRTAGGFPLTSTALIAEQVGALASQMAERFAVARKAVRDPYWDYVVSLLAMEGTVGTADFQDDKGNLWTPHGNVALLADQARFGSTSAYFDGLSDTRLAGPSHSRLDEGWFLQR